MEPDSGGDLTVRRVSGAGWLASDGEVLVTAGSKDEAIRRYRAARGHDGHAVCRIEGCTERPIAYVGTALVCGLHYVDALYALEARRLTPACFLGDPAELLTSFQP